MKQQKFFGIILVICVLVTLMLQISKIKSLMHFIKQIQSSNTEYAKESHLDILLVCVDKEHQGKGIATELVDFAKKMSDDKGLPILFDTDMKDYAEIYQHLGCRLYNQETADRSICITNLFVLQFLHGFVLVMMK